MTQTCRRVVCGHEFTASHSRQVYCSRQCAAQDLRPWEKAAATRKETMGARRRERIEATPKEELEKVGYAKGYQAARYKYHYRTFLRQLSALLGAHAAAETVSASEARPGTR